MNEKERFELIKRNTEEIFTEDELKKLLKKKKIPVAYWGTAPTGRPHIGYFLPALKIADLLKAGFKVKILLADLHAALDNTPWPVLEKRYEYYKEIIPSIIKAIGADTKNLEFVKGSNYQLKKEYVFDTLKMSTFTSVHDTNKAASEVVKMGKNPKLSGLIYPIMQAVDEEYLGVDIQIGGTDQRKIMVLARENLPKIGYSPRIELMHPLVPGLIGEKMSSSDIDSKIDLLDGQEDIKRKLKKAYCPEGEIKGNGILSFIKYVLMVIKSDSDEEFLIERDEKWGGNLKYKKYDELEKDFISKKLHPMDLKTALSREIDLLLDPIRKNMKGKEKIIKEACF